MASGRSRDEPMTASLHDVQQIYLVHPHLDVLVNPNVRSIFLRLHYQMLLSYRLDKADAIEAFLEARSECEGDRGLTNVLAGGSDEDGAVEVVDVVDGHARLGGEKMRG